MSTGKIMTYGGYMVAPLTPRVEMLSISDIAHALSNECRFNGHCRPFYSVAEHSVRVADLLREWGFGAEVQMSGLLHDATEAYLKDLPRPLKELDEFKNYRRAEEALARAVRYRFGLAEQPDIVHRADNVLLATEGRDLMHPNWVREVRHLPPPLSVRISPWSPEMAEHTFLKRFQELEASR